MMGQSRGRGYLAPTKSLFGEEEDGKEAEEAQEGGEEEEEEEAEEEAALGALPRIPLLGSTRTSGCGHSRRRPENMRRS